MREVGNPLYRAERTEAALLSAVKIIRKLADAEKEALGFIPEAAYRDAIMRQRLIAMCRVNDISSDIVGFVLFSGIFPHARIQQLVVAKEHRRSGVASALINEVVSHLESLGYLSITAAVASDLVEAQLFYERNGFERRRSIAGGKARKRTIVLRSRDLDTESLLSGLDPLKGASASAIELGLRKRSAGHAPLYAIDLNVLFDVVRAGSRPRAQLAERLIGAALAHKIRLAIAPEFIVELKRNTTGIESDPILRLALQLPRLASIDEGEAAALTQVVHDIVFAVPGASSAGTVQALSDARHLAEAAIARASAYVTSDQQILAARDILLSRIGIDVATLDEFAALLPADLANPPKADLKGINHVVTSTDPGVVRGYLSDRSILSSLIEEFVPLVSHLTNRSMYAIFEDDQVVAVAVLVAPIAIDGVFRALVHVRPDHVSGEVFADHLVDRVCRDACRSSPAAVELFSPAGQSLVRRSAMLRGFLPTSTGDGLIKVALGQPVTPSNWANLAKQTRRKTGLRLPERVPDSSVLRVGLEVQRPDGTKAIVRLAALEDALSPAILAWPGRSGVIVPIARNFADELLGTGSQLPLFGNPEASFVTRRVYFSSPRAAGLMRPETPVLFYESKRSGGRGAVVAVARIVDATVMEKGQVPGGFLRRAVVEDVDRLSASDEILATSFDNLLAFPAPVLLETLRSLDVVGSANLQTATPLTDSGLCAILERGWQRA